MKKEESMTFIEFVMKIHPLYLKSIENRKQREKLETMFEEYIAGEVPDGGSKLLNDAFDMITSEMFDSWRFRERGDTYVANEYFGNLRITPISDLNKAVYLYNKAS